MTEDEKLGKILNWIHTHRGSDRWISTDILFGLVELCRELFPAPDRLDELADLLRHAGAVSNHPGVWLRLFASGTYSLKAEPEGKTIYTGHTWRNNAIPDMQRYVAECEQTPAEKQAKQRIADMAEVTKALECPDVTDATRKAACRPLAELEERHQTEAPHG